MFYKINQGKKYLKEAYKGAGLVVGLTHEGILYTSGSFWLLCQDMAHTPKEYKATIIELAGELPSPGEEFRATENGNQIQIPNLDLYDLPAKYADIDRTGSEYEETNVYIKWPKYFIRICTSVSGTGAKLIRHDAWNMINREGIDYDSGETEIEGPLATPDERGFLIWHNDDTWLAMCPIWVAEDTDQRDEINTVLTGFHKELTVEKAKKNEI